MEDKRDLSFPGSADGMTFHVRGKKLSKQGQDKIDQILADTPTVSYGTRELVVAACGKRTTSGVRLHKADGEFYLAVLNQIAAGLRPSEIFKRFGLSYSEFRGILDRDTRLMDLYKSTVELGREARTIILEDEAIHRAVEGDDEPVYYKGTRVDTKKVKSDSLLTTLLKAHAPDRYADRSVVEHGGTVLQLNIEGVREKDGDGNVIDVTPLERNETHDDEPKDEEETETAERRSNPEIL